MSGGTFAVSRAGGRPARARSSLLGRTALCGALAAGLGAGLGAGLAPPAALAGPQGTVVVGGAVDVRQSGTHTEFTQHSNTALLNHKSFDIGAGESANFAQPSAGALAVNRVVGSDLPTSIAGRLTANGNVWVLNPSGVAIRGTAQVNVGGLLATTATISDEAILAGERSFAGAPAGSAVSNAGSVTAGGGGVVLVAPVVSNTGTISTQGSDVALGAGSGFTVDFDGDGLTRFEVAPGSGVGLTNSGTISARGGAAYISAASAGTVQTAVVSIGGRVEATRAEARGGVILISGGKAGVTEVSGTLDASQATGSGGRIAVTGERVDIRGGALIDASGAAGGGTVEIGGGLRGAPIASPVLAAAGAPSSAPLPTARRTVVRPGARVAANGGDAGDGGRVIVWSDEATAFGGVIEARGGRLEGDGGFAEVSGKRRLGFDGAVDLSAPSGAPGTLLLDPESVTIVAGAAAQDGELGDRVIEFDDLPDSFTISAGAVAAAVSLGNTIIEAADSITQSAPVTLSGDRSLTYLTGTGDIRLDAPLTGTGNLLTIDAGGDVALGELGVAALDLRAGGSIGQAAGTGVTVFGGTRITAGGDVALAAAGNDFSAVDLFGQAVSIADQNAIRLGQVDASALTVTARGAITDTAGKAIDVTGAAELAAMDGGAFFDIALDGDDADAGDRPHDFGRFAASGQDIAVADADGIALGTVAAHAADGVPGNGNDGNLTVLAGGSVSQAAGTMIAAPGDATIRTTAGGVTLTRATNDFADERSGHAVAVQAPGAVRLSDTDSMSLGAASGSSLEASADDLSIGGALDFAGTVELTNAAGDLATVGVGGPDANPSTFDISDAEIARVQAQRLVVTSGRGGIDVQGVTLDGESLTLDAGTGANAGTVVFSTAATAVPGDLSVRGASVAQDADAPLLVDGATGLSATGTVTLSSVGNDFDADAPGGAAGDAADEVDAAGTAVTLVDRTAIALGAIDATALEVGAGGSITDTSGKAVEVSGTTDLSALAGADAFDIRLDNGDAGRHDFGGAVSARGEDIVLGDRSGIVLGAVQTRAGGQSDPAADGTIAFYDDNGDGAFDASDPAAAGDLTVRAGGAISDTGAAIRVEGRTRLEAVAGAARFDITLDGPGGTGGPGPHDFDSNATGDAAHEVDAVGRNVSLTDAGAIALGAIDATALEVGAGGSITDTSGKAVEVSGTTDLSALAGADAFDIRLDNGDAGRHDFGGAVSARGEDIVLGDRSGIVLGAVQTRAGGQSDPAADGTIAFYDDNGDGAFDASDPAAAGDLTVRAGGAISDTGAAIRVEGRTRLEAVAGAARFDITLDGPGGTGGPGPHDFDSNATGDAAHEVDAVGRNVSLTDAGAIALGAIDATALEVGAGGSITDTSGKAVEVSGTTDLSALAGADAFDIRLDNGDAGRHDFGGAVSARGEDIVLGDRSGIVLGAVQTRAGGQSDPAADGTIAFYDDNGDGAFDASDPAAAGDLTVRAGGAISDTGAAIRVEGRTRLEAVAGAARFDITLDGPGGTGGPGPHDFDSNATGDAAHEVDAVGRNVSLTDAGAIALGAIDATALEVGAGGSITDTSGKAVEVSGTTDLSALAGADAFDIRLDNGDAGRHDFGGAVSARGEDIVLGDRSGIVLGAVQTRAGGQSDPAADGTIAFYDDNGDGAFDASDPAAAGDLTVRAGGAISDTGAAIRVEGRTRLEAVAGAARFDITLDGPGGTGGPGPHDFDSNATGDAAHEVDAVGRNVSLTDAGAIALGAIDATALEVGAGGSITDTSGKAVEVSGTTDLSALAGADAFDIRLDNGDAGRHDFGGAVSARGEDIVLGDRSGIVLGAVQTRAGGQSDPAADGTIAFYDDNGDGAFDASDPAAAGDLTVRAGGAISDTGAAIRVEGRTRLEAVAGAARFDITLDGPGGTGGPGPHDFDSNATGDAAHEVDAVGRNVSLTDAGAIALGAIDATALEVGAGGSITDTSGKAVEVSGTTDLSALAGADAFDIRLDNGDAGRHDFGGAVSARGEDIVLGDRSGIVLGAVQTRAGGQSDPAADGTIAFYDDNGDGAFDASDPAAAGDLTVRAGGAISDTGAAIRVEGRTRLEAVAGAARFDITLDGPGGTGGPGPHDFDSNATGDAAHEVDAVGRNVSLTDAGAIALGDVRASGDLSVTAGGTVTDTAGEGVAVGNDTTVGALDPRTADPSDDDYSDIVLDNAGLHEFGSIDLTGEGVRLVDRQDLSIVRVASRRDGTPDATLGGDSIFLEVGQGDFAFQTGPGSVPLDAVRNITLSAPNGAFESNPAIAGKDLPDGLTFRSQTGDITLDVRDGFVIQDVLGTAPFTLDAPDGIARIRIGEGAEPEFFGIGTADFLAQARQPGFNPLFAQATIGDIDLFRVTGDFALVARSPVTVRFQNTLGTANEGSGTTVLGTSYFGGTFAGISLFGNFLQAGGTTAALRGFRDAGNIGEIPLLLDDANTVNGCAILVPTACQPIGSLLPALGYQDGLLLGIRFVAPTQDLDDPFTNRGDEEEWE